MFFRHRSRCESNVFTIITQAAIKHSEMHKHIFDIDLNYLTMKQEKKKVLLQKVLGTSGGISPSPPRHHEGAAVAAVSLPAPSRAVLEQQGEGAGLHASGRSSDGAAQLG